MTEVVMSDGVAEWATPSRFRWSIRP
jgi:hypothetical protein